MKRKTTRADLILLNDFGPRRKELRRRIAEIKRARRMLVGPYANFMFENFETMLHQVHEMLFIEQGGDAQLQSELDAYNTLIPSGRNLVATLMFEIENPVTRAAELARLGYVEDRIQLRVGRACIPAVPVGKEERTRTDGKTSAVRFIAFELTPEAIADFKGGSAPVSLAIEHPCYGHSAQMSEAVRQALSRGLD